MAATEGRGGRSADGWLSCCGLVRRSSFCGMALAGGAIGGRLRSRLRPSDCLPTVDACRQSQDRIGRSLPSRQEPLTGLAGPGRILPARGRRIDPGLLDYECWNPEGSRSVCSHRLLSYRLLAMASRFVGTQPNGHVVHVSSGRPSTRRGVAGCTDGLRVGLCDRVAGRLFWWAGWPERRAGGRARIVYGLRATMWAVRAGASRLSLVASRPVI